MLWLGWRTSEIYSQSLTLSLVKTSRQNTSEAQTIFVTLGKNQWSSAYWCKHSQRFETDQMSCFEVITLQTDKQRKDTKATAVQSWQNKAAGNIPRDLSIDLVKNKQWDLASLDFVTISVCWFHRYSLLHVLRVCRQLKRLFQRSLGVCTRARDKGCFCTDRQHKIECHLSHFRVNIHISVNFQLNNDEGDCRFCFLSFFIFFFFFPWQRKWIHNTVL